jgi:hypothetical protein
MAKGMWIFIPDSDEDEGSYVSGSDPGPISYFIGAVIFYYIYLLVLGQLLKCGPIVQGIAAAAGLAGLVYIFVSQGRDMEMMFVVISAISLLTLVLSGASLINSLIGKNFQQYSRIIAHVFFGVCGSIGLLTIIRHGISGLTAVALAFAQVYTGMQDVNFFIFVAVAAVLVILYYFNEKTIVRIVLAVCCLFVIACAVCSIQGVDLLREIGINL